MGGFIIGAGCAIGIAVVSYVGYNQYAVTTAGRVDDQSVRIEQAVYYGPYINDGTVER